nr:rhodanese-like domain-containing protein [Kurthia senegalensis]
MAWYWIVLIIVVIVVAMALITARRSKKAVTMLSEEDFKAGYRKAQLIDVREKSEFDSLHILGARNLPTTLLRSRYKELRQDIPVYLYCENGGRSSRAALFLKKKGYTKLYALDGGFKNWSGHTKTSK